MKTTYLVGVRGRELRVLDSPRGIRRVPVVLNMIREVLDHSGQPLRAHDNSVTEDTDGVRTYQSRLGHGHYLVLY